MLNGIVKTCEGTCYVYLNSYNKNTDKLGGL